jgi:hypothetical protein
MQLDCDYEPVYLGGSITRAQYARAAWHQHDNQSTSGSVLGELRLSRQILTRCVYCVLLNTVEESPKVVGQTQAHSDLIATC